MNTVEALLEDIKMQSMMTTRLLARLAFAQEDVKAIVTNRRKGGRADKYIQAYNLCDGKTLISQIAKMVRIDQGNFSRDLQKWEDAGILMKFSSSKEVFPLALLPINKSNGQV